jgi:uncharacterized protein (TIGR02246 family)
MRPAALVRVFLVVAVVATVTSGALATAGDARAAEAIACTPVAGAAQLIKPGAILLVGEMHGTREMPAAVADLACMAVEHKLPVTVALEIPPDDGEAIERYFISGDRAALLAREHWRRAYQDGRSSQGMLALVDRLRRLRQSGARLRVIGFDARGAAGQARDAVMADAFAAAWRAQPGDVTVGLVGNVHNRVTVGVPWDAAYKPMGWYLAQQKIALTSLRATWATGKAWSCDDAAASSCGPHDFAGKGTGPAPTLTLASKDATVHGTLYVGAISAAPPAIAELADAVRAELLREAAAWNAGDLDGYLRGYAPDATFIGATDVQHGLEAITAKYRKRYGDARRMGTLTFSDLDIRLLSSDYALVIGRWALARPPADGGAAGGVFTLTLHHGTDGWRIVVDHTS